MTELLLVLLVLLVLVQAGGHIWPDESSPTDSDSDSEFDPSQEPKRTR